jgi:DNA repair exonuclease SbcCD ATPase subunit
MITCPQSSERGKNLSSFLSGEEEQSLDSQVKRILNNRGASLSEEVNKCNRGASLPEGVNKCLIGEHSSFPEIRIRTTPIESNTLSSCYPALQSTKNPAAALLSDVLMGNTTLPSLGALTEKGAREEAERKLREEKKAREELARALEDLKKKAHEEVAKQVLVKEKKAREEANQELVKEKKAQEEAAQQLARALEEASQELVRQKKGLEDAKRELEREKTAREEANQELAREKKAREEAEHALRRERDLSQKVMAVLSSGEIPEEALTEDVSAEIGE